LNQAELTIHVVGGGLAGCEAALQLARFGIPVRLHEMRPGVSTPAHRSDRLAEIVCSNSLKSTDPATGSGLLKAELKRLGCRLLQAAEKVALPAGSALAVDRERFTRRVEEMIAREPLITVARQEIRDLEALERNIYVLATGPLTSSALQERLAVMTGGRHLHFFDAIAPTVTRESLQGERLYRASRYGKGGADYLNAPLDEAGYRRFHRALIAADKVDLPDFDRDALFAGCQPIEEIAFSGPESLTFGPLRPVGLPDPRTERLPYAVLQLRREDQADSLYGLVGCQTRLKPSEQKRIFRLIPGLEGADFVRYGQMHRNFYCDTPRVLERTFALRNQAHVRLAGQITGVEGYVESIASGLVTAWILAGEQRARPLTPWPATTMIGALIGGFLFDATTDRLAPMNAHFGLLPPLAGRIKGRRRRRLAQSERALNDLDRFLATEPLRGLLAAGRPG
jgi:methylenetetrahydrofolate--tRNA-(uracil-5-)-methyltransferase